LKIAQLVSILQDEWGVIRDCINRGPGGGCYASLGVALRDRGSSIRSVMHRHLTTMTAVLYSAPFEQLTEQLQRLEKLVGGSGSKRGRDEFEVGSGPSVPTKSSQIPALNERMVDGNSANPLYCTREECTATSECYFSHDRKPGRVSPTAKSA
jgi:hypothetical protein